MTYKYVQVVSVKSVAYTKKKSQEIYPFYY
jgi:hypothetical protein